MQLVFDIGNTMAKCAFFDEQEAIVARYQMKTIPEKSYDDYLSPFLLFLKSKDLDPHCVKGAVISSVVPSLTPLFLRMIQEVFGVEAKTIGPGFKTGVAVRTDNPKEVGADLIGDAMGVHALYGKGPAIVADMGTATKLILLDRKGDFVGCSIAPGLGLGLSALVNNTAALTEVSLQIPPKIIGKNTTDSMNSGLIYGAAFQIKAMADAVEKEAGYPCRKILTGGYSEYLVSLLPEFDYEPDLLVKGLEKALLSYQEKEYGR